MAVIVTYDIPSKHTDLKNALKSESYGYKDQIPGIKNCKTIYFPNTTLYHPSNSAEQALEDVKEVCKKLGIKLERCVATIWENWAAICGQDF